MRVTMIDPPSGWMYGFPRPIPASVPRNAIGEWLVSCGYPKQDIPFALAYSWYWETDTLEL